MVAVVKSEWHQVEKRYGIDIDESILSEIYPDLGEGEVAQLLKNLTEGIADIEDILQDARDNNVDIDWDWLDEDDWWTDRKGGYDITYNIDEDRDFSASGWAPLDEDGEIAGQMKCKECGWVGHWSNTFEKEGPDGDQIDCCPECEGDIEDMPEEEVNDGATDGNS